MTDEASPRPWRVKQSPIGSNAWIVSGETFVASASRPSDAALIVDAVNLKARIDEAMADKSGYLHPVVLDGKPMVCVTPPPSEAEEIRMYREAEARLFADRERFRRGYYEAEERNDRLRDIVRRFLDLFTPGTIHPAGTMERLLREARAAIGEEAK